MVNLIFGCLLVIVLWYLPDIIKAFTSNVTSTTPSASASIPGNKKPCYYGYTGGWAKITICSECGLKALYDDCQSVYPCHVCGGEREEAVGKWVKGKGWTLKESNKRT